MLSLCTKSNFLKAGVAISLSYILFKLVNSYYKKPSPAQSSIDVSSFSNLNEVTTESYHLDLCIDFDSKKLTGTIILNMKSLINGLSLVCLDSKLLKIKNAFYKGQKIPFHVEKQLNGAALGDKLVFILPELIKALNSFTLTIDYETISDSSESSALNWLEPKQTLGKQLPYFYTQSEPIYSRTIAPMQDSPSVKSTYSARISVPKDFNVFMSAKKIQETEENFQK